MPESMTPAQVMVTARVTELERWSCTLGGSAVGEIFRRENGERVLVRTALMAAGYGFGHLEADMRRLAEEAAMRSALRALAEMEPTEKEIKTVAREVDLECGYYYSKGHINDDDIKVIRKSAILAAASEGEQE